MTSFVAYRPETGEIVEWGTTRDPITLRYHGLARGLVAMEGKGAPPSHYVAEGQILLLPDPLGSAEVVGGILKVSGPMGAEVLVGMEVVGQCDEDGLFEMPAPEALAP